MTVKLYINEDTKKWNFKNIPELDDVERYA